MSKEQRAARQRRARQQNPAKFRESERARAKKRWADPKEHDKRRAWYWRRVYGVSEKFVKDIFVLQGGGCAVCRRVLEFGKHLHIDHDHVTKKVRGILCRGCNQSEGNIFSAGLTPNEFAQRLTAYLKEPPASIVELV